MKKKTSMYYKKKCVHSEVKNVDLPALRSRGSAVSNLQRDVNLAFAKIGTRHGESLAPECWKAVLQKK